MAGDGQEDRVAGHRDRVGQQRLFTAEVAGCLDIGDEVRREHVEAESSDAEDEEDLEHSDPVLAEGLANRAELFGPFGSCLLEELGFVGLRPDPQTDCRQRKGQKERNTPTP